MQSTQRGVFVYSIRYSYNSKPVGSAEYPAVVFASTRSIVCCSWQVLLQQPVRALSFCASCFLSSQHSCMLVVCTCCSSGVLGTATRLRLLSTPCLDLVIMHHALHSLQSAESVIHTGYSVVFKPRRAQGHLHCRLKHLLTLLASWHVCCDRRASKGTLGATRTRPWLHRHTTGQHTTCMALGRTSTSAWLMCWQIPVTCPHPSNWPRSSPLWGPGCRAPSTPTQDAAAAAAAPAATAHTAAGRPTA